MKQHDLTNTNDTNNSRRDFLKNSSVLTGVTFLSGFGLAGLPLNAISAEVKKSTLLGFSAIPSSTIDDITIAKGYKAQVLLSWGDKLFTNSPDFDPHGKNTAADQDLQFGDNNDGMSLLSINENHAVMSINHEYYEPKNLFAHGEAMPKSIEDVKKAQAAMGVTVVEIKRSDNNSAWKAEIGAKYNRRITANTPMQIKGPASGHDLLKTSADSTGTKVLGTLNNCANGQTPWGTYLTCEENFDDFFGYANPKNAKITDLEKRYGIKASSDYGWEKFDERFDLEKNPNEPNRFGWVVEIDPMDPSSTPVKHTALGRIKHENAAVKVADNGQVVVYMGDDEVGEYVYKFITKEKYVEGDASNKNLLDSGTLYVARFNGSDKPMQGNGEWIELTYGKNGLDEKQGFKSQADIVINTRKAADTVMATKMDRPEWIAVNPINGQVFATMTNNSKRGSDKIPLNAANPRAENKYGQIVRWTEKDNNHTSMNFDWDLYVLVGNPNVHADGLYRGSENITAENTFNSPDGIGFDKFGRVWIQTDGKYTNKDDYAGQGNNSMLAGDPVTGELRRFLTGPKSCEITGIAFTPDSKTMFINIQHPGEKGDSNFPNNSPRPRSSVVMITKDDNGVIGS